MAKIMVNSNAISVIGYSGGGGEIGGCQLHYYRSKLLDGTTNTITMSEGRYIAISAETKMVGESGHLTSTSISSTGTTIATDHISHSFGDGNKRDVDISLALIDCVDNDTITLTKGHNDMDYPGFFMLIKGDDFSSLNITNASSHYDNTESNTISYSGIATETIGIVFELTNQYVTPTVSATVSQGNAVSLNTQNASCAVAYGKGDFTLTCDDMNGYASKVYFTIEI